MMMETAREVAELDVQGIKIHLIAFVKRNSNGKTIRKRNAGVPFEFEDYIKLVM